MSASGTDAGGDAQAAEFLRALAHPMRLRILRRLLDGELSVGGFESQLGLRQPSLSQQLAQLREAGLVATRREAKSVFYRLADARVRGVLAALHGAFAPGPDAASVPRLSVRAGLRSPLTQAPARTFPPVRAPSPAPAVPRPRAAAECGVFAVAGWPPANGGKDGGNQGGGRD